MVEQTTPGSAPSGGLVLLTDWPKQIGYPPIGQLRALTFNADKNGFNKCIRRIGRRVLISVPDYFQWVEEQNANIPVNHSANGGVS